MLARRSLILGLLASSGCALFPKTRTPTLPAEATAPSWSLADQNGRQVSLADLTRHGPALLVFYRGYW